MLRFCGVAVLISKIGDVFQWVLAINLLDSIIWIQVQVTILGFIPSLILFVIRVHWELSGIESVTLKLNHKWKDHLEVGKEFWLVHQSMGIF